MRRIIQLGMKVARNAPSRNWGVPLALTVATGFGCTVYTQTQEQQKQQRNTSFLNLSPARNDGKEPMVKLKTRQEHLSEVQQTEEYDVIVIGGGCNGAGVFLEAANRGLKCLLVESNDFAAGTSSKSTKLIHGGVRYLQEVFEFSLKGGRTEKYNLVKEGLRERTHFVENAFYMNRQIPFVVPTTNIIMGAYYYIGVLVYHAVYLSQLDSNNTNFRFKIPQWVGGRQLREYFPNLDPKYKYGVVYYDGQFNDTRMNMDILLTGTQDTYNQDFQKGNILNYAQVTSLLKDERTGENKGVLFTDKLSGKNITAKAKCVVNCAGAFADDIRTMDNPKSQKRILSVAGSHMTMPQDFCSRKHALVIPKTQDGRILFLVPWQNHTIIGTTERALDQPELNPTVSVDEMLFMAKEVGNIYTQMPSIKITESIQSKWAGIRPLILSDVKEGEPIDTKKVARTHVIEVSKNDEALVDRIDTQKYIKSNGQLKKVVSDSENQYTAGIDDAGNVTVIVHKLNRYVSIKPSSPATQLVFISGGYILIASNNGQIFQYLASNGKLSSAIRHHNSKLLALEYNPVSKRILTITHDQCTLWDSVSFTKIKTLFAKASHFAAGALTPNGQNLVTSFQDGSVYVWSLSNFEVTSKSEVEENMKNQKICISADSQRFVIGGCSAYLYYCDLSHSPMYFSSFMLPSGSTSVKKLKFTHATYLGIITDQQVFYSIDSSTNQIVLEFRLPKNKGIVDFDINPNNLELLTVSGNGEIFKHDLQKLIVMEMNTQKKRLEGGIESSLVFNVLKPGNQNRTIKFESHLNDISYGKENIVINGEAKLVNDPDDLLKSNHPLRETNIVNLCTFPKHTLEKMFKSALINVETLPNMSAHKLRQFLEKHKAFPDKHRALIYKQFLQLPLNIDHFATLVQKGLYNSFKDLYRKYPINDSKLYQKMQTVLSCLSHFCELFGESDQFIQIAFPFVKLFGQEELLAFEIILCFTHQILQNFFVDFPHPPLDLLQNIDEIIKYNEPVLHSHLKEHGFKFVDYVWPFLKGFFTTVLDKESWLQLVDHLIAYNDIPELSMFFTAAFITYFKNPLMRIKSRDELEIFISRQNPVNISHIIESGFSLLKRTPMDKIFVKFIKTLPLSKTSYNQFTNYNMFNVTHSKLTRQQETEAEMKLEESKHKIRQMQSMTDQILSVEQRYKEKQENLIRSEQIRRDEVMYNAEQKLARQMKLEESLKQTRKQQLNKIIAMTQNSLLAQDELRKKEVDLLEAELYYQQQSDNQYQQSRQEDTQILEMEAKAAARLRQVMELREQEDRQRMVRMDMDIHKQQDEDRDNALVQQWRMEDTEMRLRRETLKQKKLQDLYKFEEDNEKRVVEAKMLETEILKEQQMRDIERERRLRHIAEQELDQNEKFTQYAKEAEQQQLRQQVHKLQETFNDSKQKTINTSLARLYQTEEENSNLLNEIQAYKNLLSQKQKELQTAELESQIIEKKREAEERMFEDVRV